MKFTILILLFAVGASLLVAAWELWRQIRANVQTKDAQGMQEARKSGVNNRKLFRALLWRITLVSLMMLVVVGGVLSGRLNSKAPWDRSLHPQMTGDELNRSAPRTDSPAPSSQPSP